LSVAKARRWPQGIALDFRLFFAYAEIVSSTCRVSFEDGARVTHTVSVSATSLYEAAVLAIAEFKKSGFAFGEVGPGTKLKVAVEAPTTIHELSVGKLQEWLDSSGKTPREQAVKVTLRQILGRG
jgi:phenylalanyl-tRNA synthetase beta subunit